LPYCCDPTTSCDDAWVAGGGARAGTRLYCGERALIDGTYDSHADAAAHPRQVPVCVRAQPCGLGDPYPCTNGSCACRDGTACTVKVLPAGDAGGALQGTTACEVPGKGRTGDHCPPACAAGYFCSESSGVCLKMCEARTGDVTCAPGKCQVTAGFPPGWGVCVGLTPAAK